MTFTNKRKTSYDESFLKLGVTKSNGKPNCVICLKILLKESMKKNILQRHLITNHHGCIDKPAKFFERKLQSIASLKSIRTASTGKNKSAVYSSYFTSYQIVKQKKPHFIGEKLLMSVMKDVVKIMKGKKKGK